MGSFDYKGRLIIYIKEFFSFMPFGNYILGLILRERDPLSLQQKITINLINNLNNSGFQLSNIQLGLNNKSLQYKSAHLRVFTNLSPYSFLFGFRYFMREWFYTVAIVSITLLSFINASLLAVCCYTCSGCRKKSQNTN